MQINSSRVRPHDRQTTLILCMNDWAWIYNYAYFCILWVLNIWPQWALQLVAAPLQRVRLVMLSWMPFPLHNKFLECSCSTVHILEINDNVLSGFHPLSLLSVFIVLKSSLNFLLKIISLGRFFVFWHVRRQHSLEIICVVYQLIVTGNYREQAVAPTNISRLVRGSVACPLH